MALIFVLLTQLINLTTSNIDFEVDHSRRLLPRLRPGRTRFAKQSRVLRWIRERDPEKIRVLLDGEFTGIELHPQVVLWYVRVVFRVDNNVLCVDGVRENRGNDFLLRHRYFGFMRNFYWNSRPVEPIDRSDSRLATKSRNIEGQCPNLAPFVDMRNIEIQCPNLAPSVDMRDAAPPQKESPRKNHKDIKEDKIETEGNGNKSRPQPPNGTATTQQATRLRGGDESSTTTNVVGDSFVHGILIAFCFMVFILIKFLL